MDRSREAPFYYTTFEDAKYMTRTAPQEIPVEDGEGLLDDTVTLTITDRDGAPDEARIQMKPGTPTMTWAELFAHKRPGEDVPSTPPGLEDNRYTVAPIQHKAWWDTQAWNEDQGRWDEGVDLR